ncbi:DUF551 domain-containing protein [Escherichia coli]|nr:DUF551 domain-containing protein [Escherichia coli]EGM8068260.1 DUF551 domain-containing protein [Escherichia coli]EHW4879856.1 DUF551 domain-containing protein [Escherichia coli]
MTTITKERLLTIKQWRETYGPGSNVVLPAEEAEELARIALAALEAEPVLYQSCTRPTWNSGVPWTEWKERSREGYENDLRFTDTPDHAGWINKCRKLYTTPPVPVIQADVAQAIEKLKRKLVECNRYNYCADAVKGVEYACHAAMLQGSQPVSQTYKFPVNTPCQDAPAHIWLQTAGVWPEDGELSELTWCSHNQHHDDTLYVRADLVNGNYPVTPDGWISCSERMPEMGERQCYVLAADFKNNYPPNIPNTQVGVYGDWFNDGKPTWDDGDGEDLYLKEVTHWMQLPEPPEQDGE